MIYGDSAMPKAKVFKHDILRYPRLDTVLMIEDALKKARGGLSSRALWKSLPKKTMWQTFVTTLDYLEYSGKIMFDRRDKHPIWGYDPETIERLHREGLIIGEKRPKKS